MSFVSAVNSVQRPGYTQSKHYRPATERPGFFHRRRSYFSTFQPMIITKYASHSGFLLVNLDLPYFSLVLKTAMQYKPASSGVYSGMLVFLVKIN